MMGWRDPKGEVGERVVWLASASESTHVQSVKAIITGFTPKRVRIKFFNDDGSLQTATVSLDSLRSLSERESADDYSFTGRVTGGGSIQDWDAWYNRPRLTWADLERSGPDGPTTPP